MSHPLERLTIRAFRGATNESEIHFDKTKPVCLIFGENGSGKSTIVDSIDFVCNQKFGSLQLRSLGRGKRKDEFIPAVGKKQADVKVELAFSRKVWTATHEKSGVKTDGPPDRPSALILRRATLLEFVEADPAERYRRLATHIAVEAIEACEQSLRDTCKQIENERAEAEDSAKQARAALETLWEKESCAGPGYESWARSECAKSIAEHKQTISMCDAVKSRYQRLELEHEELQNCESEEEAARSSHAQAAKALTEGEARLATGASVLLGTLKSARDYFAAVPNFEECPVCLRPVQSVALAAQIQRRIEELQALDNLRATEERARKDRDVAAKETAKKRTSFVTAARQLVRSMIAGSWFEESDHVVDWALFPSLTGESAAPADTESRREGMLLFTQVQTAIKALDQRVEAARSKVGRHNAIKQHLQTIDEKAKSLESLTELSRRAKRSLSLIADKRKGFVDSVLVQIAGDVEHLYKSIHVDEPIGNLKLSLDPKQRASLQFEGRFQSLAATPPQAYYSESHLDTLGICIFLALAKRQPRDNTLVILDDVLTSVDQPHLSRLMALLHDEAEGFTHLLLTTHYREWRELYRYSRGPAGKVQLIELKEWSYQAGIRLEKTKLAVDELAAAIKAESIDRQLLASKAGILLEELLDYLTEVYECPLPRKPRSKWTIADFRSGLGSKLTKVLKVSRQNSPEGQPKEPQELKPLLDALFEMSWIRNEIGCHPNLQANTSNTQVKDFAKAVMTLATVLVCDRCGELPRRVHAGFQWRCHCQEVGLLPLRRPE